MTEDKKYQIKQCQRRFNALCFVAQYSKTAIISPRRYAPLVMERARIAKTLRDEGYSYPVIGEVMNRDHASIMNLITPKKLKSLANGE